jgi:hypothetical protein
MTPNNTIERGGPQAARPLLSAFKARELWQVAAGAPAAAAQLNHLASKEDLCH